MSGHFDTSRLRIRLMTADDIDLLVELNSDAEVMRYLTGGAMAAAESTAEATASLGTRWLVFQSHSGEFLGWVAAAPTATSGEYDLGWRFRRQAWGHGYATEAALALMERLFTHGAMRIVANTMAVNLRSRAVMDRIGLSYLRTFHLDFDDPLPGTEQGEVEYGLTLAEWTERTKF